MNKPFLYDYQYEAVKKMHDGCILVGGVGSGKSRTGLYYYFKEFGGDFMGKRKKRMKSPLNLLIITTAHKRDLGEWDEELMQYSLSTNSEFNTYKNEVVVDSWQNIKKYTELKNWFVIFDEQHAIGSGAWSKAFIDISKNNRWIMLTATPADSYMEFVPVFIANGFYKNKSQFVREHVVYNRWSKYPKVDHYINVQKLNRYRRQIVVEMKYKHEIEVTEKDIFCDYDMVKYKNLMKTRWNPFKDEPVTNAAELCYCLRKIVNSDKSRLEAVKTLVEMHKRVIIFYSFDYELELLKNMNYDMEIEIAELNGHKHQDIPKSDNWVYLVNYSSGSEAWSCTKTDTIIFFSQTYSYKTLVQSKGRIDRLTTPYENLYYYHLKSRSSIDLAINKALKAKKKFNETKFVEG